MHEQELQKILWAVDPLAEDRKLQEKCVSVLKMFSKHTRCSIEPVYVLSPDELKLSQRFFPAKVGEFRLEAEKRLALFLKKVKIPSLRQATVLVSSDLSLRSAVHTLVGYARDQHADLIIANTLARRGVSRFLLGSFAETLAMQSDIPLLLVSPKARFTGAFREILFPTDFSDGSKQALSSVAAFASEVGAKITLFHQLEYLTQFTLDQFGAAPMYTQYMAQDTARRETTAREWAQELKDMGIKTEIVINKKGAFIADAILSTAKKRNTPLLAMVSKAGPVTSVLLGSVTRQVLRHASCPVWIVHPKTYKAPQPSVSQLHPQQKGTVLL
jgi:nucleotide-binding universal stress UspA family protein